MAEHNPFSFMSTILHLKCQLPFISFSMIIILFLKFFTGYRRRLEVGRYFGCKKKHPGNNYFFKHGNFLFHDPQLNLSIQTNWHGPTHQRRVNL